MNKNFYSTLLSYSVLIIACDLLQSIISLNIGADIYSLDAFGAWLIGVGIITAVGTVFLFKYYYDRRYWFVLYTAMISLIASLCYLIVLYKIIESRQLVNYYKPMAIIALCTGIPYAISLIFLGGKKNFWLKITGIYALIIGLVFLLTVILGTSVSPALLEKIAQWTSLAGSLTAVPLIMHFLREIKLLKAENTNPETSGTLLSLLDIVKWMGCIIAIGLGTLIASQSFAKMHWAKQNFESTKALAEKFEARMFVNGKGDTLRYRLLKPAHYDPQKQYPLLVSLPYGGQPGTDTIRQIEGAAAAEVLSSDINRKKYPAFIFIPNCPAGSGWGGIPDYPSVDTLVYKAITALDTAFSIDPKRRYVTGISRGGYGAWHFICTRPDLFAAAIPVCGGDDPKLASKIVNVSVWAFHGAKDQNVPVSGSRDMIAGMRKAGQNPKYTEYPNEGHNIWYQVNITPGLWDWLFDQKRS